MIFIWRGAGLATVICLLVGMFFSWVFLEPLTPAYRGATFLVAAFCNFIIRKSEGSLFFIPIRFWTFIYLAIAVYTYFFFS